jgi:hypothetical protein
MSVSHAAVANLRPFQPGHDPRRNVGGPLSPAEKEFRRLIESEQIPRANDLLTSCFDAGMGGDMKAAELFFKVCGLIKKPTDAAAIQELAQKLLDGMLEEARARRAANGGTGP